MPFDGSGNYVLSDTIAPATNADANELQAILTDIQNALDACVVADGQSPITGALKGADGTAALPSYSFNADTNSGLYRIGADNVGLSLGGTKRVDFATTGAAITGTLDVSGAATFGGDTHVVTSTDAGATVAPTLDLYRNSASPAASDFIGSVDFNGKDSGAAKQLYARLIAQITDPTAATEDAIVLLQQVVAGTLTTMLQSSAAGISIPGTLALPHITTPLSIAGSTTANRSGSPTAGDVRYNTTLSGLEYYNGTTWIVLGQAPTVQKFTSGTAQTYTAATGVVRQRVRMCAPGAGGGGATANNGANGSAATSFQVNAAGTAWTAAVGQGGVANDGLGGAGGTGGTNGSTGTLIYRVDGGDGGGGQVSNNAGGIGGATAFGGAGRPGGNAGGAAKANSGAGGGGGNSGGNSGGGGGAGEYVEFWVTGMTTATYTVGSGGAGGSAGTNAGGNGAAGVIIIEEFYS